MSYERCIKCGAGWNNVSNYISYDQSRCGDGSPIPYMCQNCKDGKPPHYRELQALEDDNKRLREICEEDRVALDTSYEALETSGLSVEEKIKLLETALKIAAYDMSLECGGETEFYLKDFMGRAKSRFARFRGRE